MTTAEGRSEAEYVAMSEIVKEVLILRQVQAFIMPALESNHVDMVEDNQGAIKIANIRYSRKRTRHIDIKHHFIRDAGTKERFASPTSRPKINMRTCSRNL